MKNFKILEDGHLCTQSTISNDILKVISKAGIWNKKTSTELEYWCFLYVKLSSFVIYYFIKFMQYSHVVKKSIRWLP